VVGAILFQERTEKRRVFAAGSEKKAGQARWLKDDWIDPYDFPCTKGERLKGRRKEKRRSRENTGHRHTPEQALSGVPGLWRNDRLFHISP